MKGFEKHKWIQVHVFVRNDWCYVSERVHRGVCTPYGWDWIKLNQVESSWINNQTCMSELSFLNETSNLLLFWVVYQSQLANLLILLCGITLWSFPREGSREKRREQPPATCQPMSAVDLGNDVAGRGLFYITWLESLICTLRRLTTLFEQCCRSLKQCTQGTELWGILHNSKCIFKM